MSEKGQNSLIFFCTEEAWRTASKYSLFHFHCGFKKNRRNLLSSDWLQHDLAAFIKVAQIKKVKPELQFAW